MACSVTGAAGCLKGRETRNRRRHSRHPPIGYFHLDIAEVRTTDGKLYLSVAIDRTSKCVVVQLVRHANRGTASAFLVALIAAVPDNIHTVLTDNGIPFTFPPRDADGPTATSITPMFDMRCQENGIEHRLTKIHHPWPNGQVERMNRTIKDATVKRYHYGSHAQLKTHLHDFLMAYNFARRLKTLNGSRRTHTSATYGHKNQNDSPLTQPIKCWD